MALNQQTTIQFRQYAEQQCPNDNEQVKQTTNGRHMIYTHKHINKHVYLIMISQQELLITQLQEQHFAQYMQQVIDLYIQCVILIIATIIALLSYYIKKINICIISYILSLLLLLLLLLLLYTISY